MRRSRSIKLRKGRVVTSSHMYKVPAKVRLPRWRVYGTPTQQVALVGQIETRLIGTYISRQKNSHYAEIRERRP